MARKCNDISLIVTINRLINSVFCRVLRRLAVAIPSAEQSALQRDDNRFLELCFSCHRPSEARTSAAAFITAAALSGCAAVHRVARRAHPRSRSAPHRLFHELFQLVAGRRVPWRLGQPCSRLPFGCRGVFRTGSGPLSLSLALGPPRCSRYSFMKSFNSSPKRRTRPCGCSRCFSTLLQSCRKDVRSRCPSPLLAPPDAFEQIRNRNAEGLRDLNQHKQADISNTGLDQSKMRPRYIGNAARAGAERGSGPDATS